MSGLDFQVSVRQTGKGGTAYNLNSDLQGEQTLKGFVEFLKLTLITTAREVLIEEQAKGFDKDPVVVVDNRVGKPIINVSPIGKIQFIAKAEYKDIIRDAFTGILERSPVDTGLYKSTHLVYFKGNRVAENRASLETWLASDPKVTTGDQIIILNPQPYARKLERHAITATSRGQGQRLVKSRDKEGRSGKFILAPNGTYYLTSRALIRKYKSNSKIKFAFISGSRLGLTGKFKTASKASRTRNFKKQSASNYLYPAIVVTIQGGGIK